MNSKQGVIIIAGSSGGLGRELAFKANEANYPVALISRNFQQLAEIKKL